MMVLLLMKVMNLFLFVVKLDCIPHPFGVGYLFQWSLRFARGFCLNFQILYLMKTQVGLGFLHDIKHAQVWLYHVHDKHALS